MRIIPEPTTMYINPNPMNEKSWMQRRWDAQEAKNKKKERESFDKARKKRKRKNK